MFTTTHMNQMLTAIMNMITCVASLTGTDETFILEVLTEVNDFRLAKKEQQTTVN